MIEKEDLRSDYVIRSHSTLLDGFVNIMRDELDAIQEQQEQATLKAVPADKSSIRSQLAAAKAAQAEKPAAQQRQKDKGAR